MSDRDSGARGKRPAPPDGREDPGAAPGAAGAPAGPRAAAEPMPFVQRVTAEEMASWVRLEHITQETAKRLIKAAKHDFARYVREDRSAEAPPEDPSAAAPAGSTIAKGRAPAGSGAPLSVKTHKK